MSVSPVLLAALLERWRGCRSVAAVRPLASPLGGVRRPFAVSCSGGTPCGSSGAGIAGPGSVLGSIAPGSASAVPSDALVALARSAS